MREGVSPFARRFKKAHAMTHDTAIPTDVRHEIDARLATLAAEEGVRFLLAVESGSRAWGFPSPDSDYDVRFIYLRPRRDYLALSAPRDVIERPIVDEIDLNGWDVRKALGLLLRDNAVVSEWMESPIRYVTDDPAMARIADMASRNFNPQGYARHYASLGRGTLVRWVDKDGPVPVKRFFYALRPALMIRALRLSPWARPPMQMADLLPVCDLVADLLAQIGHLIALKAQTKEAGNAIRLPDLERFIHDELARADEVPAREAGPVFAKEASALFIELVENE